MRFRKLGICNPETSRQVYVGADATEEHAKALSRDVHYIHFATLALLDEQFPLNSALVLSIPKEASGAHGGPASVSDSLLARLSHL